MTDLDQYWLARLQALGRVQARYLWILATTGLFYAALRSEFASPRPDTPTLRLPIVELELGADVVFAAGATILAFLVLVIMGALRAWGYARSKLGLGAGADWQTEAVDTYPNAIDLAFYTTPMSPKPFATLAYFAYPLFLSAALVEAAWLWLDLYRSGHGLLFSRRFFLVSGLILWVGAACQVATMWFKRFSNLPRLWKTRDA